MFLARSYSHYSLLSAIPKIEKLVKSAKEKGYKTLSLCDEDTTSGLVEFFETCQKHEVKPVLGSTLRIENITKDKTLGSQKNYSKIAILAKNNLGYKRLLELVSIARTVLEKPIWHLNLEVLNKNVADFEIGTNKLKKPILGSKIANNSQNSKKLEENSVNNLDSENDSDKDLEENLEENLNQKSVNKLENSLENSLENNLENNFVIICTNEHEFGQNLRKKDNKNAELILKKYLEKIGNQNLLVEMAIATSKESPAEIKILNQKIASLCDKLDIKYIASPAPRYIESEDSEVFRTVIAIKKQVRLYEIELERDFALPKFEDLQKQYEYLPNATNFDQITDQIDIQIRANYDKHADEAFFPPFKLPIGQNSDQKLTVETYLGLLTRFGHILPENLAVLNQKIENKSEANLGKDDCQNENEITDLSNNLDQEDNQITTENKQKSEQKSTQNITLQSNLSQDIEQKIGKVKNNLQNVKDQNEIKISQKLNQKLPQIQEILKLEIAKKSDWENIFGYGDSSEIKELARIILPNEEKLKSYKDNYWIKHDLGEYCKRIDYELKIIIDKGYSSYFLVFADIMEFCRQSGIVTNTRGSAAGSMVGYLTNISVLDPIQYILPFERFLNPLRPSPPDIDGDFADDRREDVIKYILDKYGYYNVSQITTFGTMLPRAVVRDVGRVLGVNYKKCDQLSKLIPSAPQGRKTTFDWAFETSQELTQFYQKDEDVKRIIDIARKIEGNHRHASVHAAGVLITPTKLTDYCAVQWDSDHKGLACQYDMKICEKVGLVKMDILGITNLSFLGNSLALVKKRRNLDIDLLNLDTEDLPTFNLLSKGRTMGIFQLSGPAMTKYLVQLEATKVNDLMAMVALYRPGPMASIPDYIARKKNPKKVTYPYPQMSNWMQDSYGLFVYQEDLLYTAIELAGYDWGEVDVLRKGMGKKIQKVIDEQHPRFVQGCQNKGISEQKAEEIWALMVPFGAYGFNKAHSSSYGMVSFWTAFMKANFSAEFMTALMTSEMGNMEKTAAAITECQQMGIEIKIPDINISIDGYEVENDQTIRYGLSSIKNLGGDVIKFIIKERQNGIYTDLDNFLERISNFQGFNKRSLEALISSGALDSLGLKELEKVDKN